MNIGIFYGSRNIFFYFIKFRAYDLKKSIALRFRFVRAEIVQPIMVLEAMKMDNEITAPCDGKVTFGAAKGANVETNAVLAVIG